MKKATIVHIEDLRLVRRVLRGDESAFRLVFEEYYDRLYRFSLVRCDGDVHNAEDLVQQTMSRAIANLRSYRGEAQLQTWLFTICRNTIIDWRRKQGLRESTVVLAEDNSDVRSVIESYSAPHEDEPRSRTEHIELNRIVQIALDRLPKKYGDALEWKYIQGWSIAEIAVELNIGQEAAQSLMARAKRAFVDVYTGMGYDLSSFMKQADEQ